MHAKQVTVRALLKMIAYLRHKGFPPEIENAETNETVSISKSESVNLLMIMADPICLDVLKIEHLILLLKVFKLLAFFYPPSSSQDTPPYTFLFI